MLLTKMPTPPNEGVTDLCAFRFDGASTIPRLTAILMILGIVTKQMKNPSTKTITSSNNDESSFY